MMLTSDNIVLRIVSRVFDLIILNLLWIVTSIPIFTIGASTTALYTVLFKLDVDDEGYLVKAYLKAFKANFSQGTMIWAILLIIGSLIGINVLLLFKVGGSVATVGTILLLITAFILFVEVLFVFPTLARFENTTVSTMINALILPFVRLPQAIPIVVLAIMCIYITQLNDKTIAYGGVFWCTIGMSLVCYLNTFLLRTLYSPFEPAESKAREELEEEEKMIEE